MASFKAKFTVLQELFAKKPQGALCPPPPAGRGLKVSPAPARARLEDFLSDYSLHQLVTTQTFTAGSLLDVCMTNGRSLVADCRVVFCDFSPHQIIRTRVNVPRDRCKGTIAHSRVFKRIQSEAFLVDLQCCEWQRVFDSPTVDSKWRTFLSLFLPVLDKHAPIRSRKIRNPSAPPVTAATRDLMALRRGALRTCGRDSSEYRNLNREEKRKKQEKKTPGFNFV